MTDSRDAPSCSVPKAADLLATVGLLVDHQQAVALGIAVKAVLELHKPVEITWEMASGTVLCASCEDAYPCQTVQNIAGILEPIRLTVQANPDRPPLHITIVDATPEETEAAEEALRDLAQQGDEIPSTVAEKDRDTVRVLRQIRAELAASAGRPSERTTPSRREWQLEGVVADAFGIINRHLGELGST